MEKAVKLHRRILVAMLAGVGAGIAAHALVPGAAWVAWIVEHVAHPVGQVFLRLLFMLVIPLLFSALVLGVADLDLSHLGRLGLRLLGYTVVFSSIAVLTGLVLVNLFRPGVSGVPPEVLEKARAAAPAAASLPEASGVALLVAMIPDNPVKAAAQGDMLGVIVFALLFGVGLQLVQTDGAHALRAVIQGLSDVTMRLIDLVMALAPFGVAALLFTMTARVGGGLLGSLLSYVAVVLAGLLLHLLVTYSLSIRLLGGMSPHVFFRGARLAMATAFSTSSSSATLPTALKVADEELKLPRHVSRFVLTAGSTMNQNGTALYEGVTVLFLAQLFGVEMGLGQQVLVMLICILGGIGTAGVAGGSLPVVAMILGMFGIPPEGLGLILGVDRLLDMSRTTINVTGDLAVAVCVARGEPTQQGNESAAPAGPNPAQTTGAQPREHGRGDRSSSA